MLQICFLKDTSLLDLLAWLARFEERMTTTKPAPGEIVSLFRRPLGRANVVGTLRTIVANIGLTDKVLLALSLADPSIVHSCASNLASLHQTFYRHCGISVLLRTRIGGQASRNRTNRKA